MFSCGIGAVSSRSVRKCVKTMYLYNCYLSEVEYQQPRLTCKPFSSDKVARSRSSWLMTWRTFRKSLTIKFSIQVHLKLFFEDLLTLGRTRKVIPPPWYKGEGLMDPPFSFWCVAVFRNDFAFSGKPLIFLIRWSIFYG